jgi:hypothetical protein
VICEILGIIAIQLAFVAARTYLRDRNALDATPGPCLRGWHTAAWIIYGILILDGLATVLAGALSGMYVPYRLVAAFLVLLAIGWGLMVRYTELARHRQSIGNRTKASAPVKKFRETPAAKTSPAEVMPWSSDSENPALDTSPVCFVRNAGAYRPSITDQGPSIIGNMPPAVAAAVDDPRKSGSNEKKRVAVDP